MISSDQARVEAGAFLLIQTQQLLNKAHWWFLVLGDMTGAYTINRIINDMNTERRRWLGAVDNHRP